MSYKLGSLFDGSGGFPLAGSLCGIAPVWAAEVEPYPIAVTRSRFPNMRHLGDISKVNGAEIEPVDVITFGSPCQDLSVAGKRAGLKHEDNGDEETTRSGLFMEAVRIIKEMRAATNGIYPRIAIWENVPGAFSSNKGEDFRTVLQELIQIIEPCAVMPAVPKAGWPYADSYIGDGWSLAYRVFDAQYWGVPQRRRRIHLVVDFRGERARQVLFAREGVRGYFAAGGTPRQATPGNAKDITATDNREGASVVELATCVVFRKGTRPHSAEDAQKWEVADIANTLNTFDRGDSRANELVVERAPAYSMKSIARNGKALTEQTNPICTSDYKDPDVVAYPEEGKYTVRRLTPTEYARLQGFPGWWGHIDQKEAFTPEEYVFWIEVRNTHAAINGKTVKEYTEKQMLTWYNKLHTDSAEYKMWGNGIALPPALYCMQGIVDALGGVTE